jgi:hypothetical protein
MKYVDFQIADEEEEEDEDTSTEDDDIHLPE